MRYLVVGDVAEDREAERWVPGGPSLYAARVAASLGPDVWLLTHVTPQYDASVFRGLQVIPLPAVRLTRYDNHYDTAGHRSQLIEPARNRISAQWLTQAFHAVQPDVIHLTPSYHELPKQLPAAAGALTGFSLQGTLRERARNGRVTAEPQPWTRTTALAQAANWTFASIEDTGGDCEAAASLARILTNQGGGHILTAGDQGAIRFQPGHPAVPIPPARTGTIIDPTGAGDAFATTFLIRLFETGDIDDASQWAAAAGALAIERTGVTNVPSREEVETRAREGSL